MSSPAAPRILVADEPCAVAALRSALRTPCELVPVHTLEQARAGLAPPPALVVCGCHFDEGRMYDLLRQVAAQPSGPRIPFVAVRCLEGHLLDDVQYESVQLAVSALGGDAFVDLLRWRQRWGTEEAAQRLTALVQSLVSGNPEKTL